MEAKTPNGSDVIEVVEDVLVASVGTCDIAPTFLVGVAARLTPLFLVPLEGGVPGVLRSARVTPPRRR